MRTLKCVQRYNSFSSISSPLSLPKSSPVSCVRSVCVTCSGMCPGQVDYVRQGSASLECQLCLPWEPLDAQSASRSFPAALVPLGENSGNARACQRTREGNSREAGLGKGKLVQTGSGGLGVKVLESSWYPCLARGCLCGLVWVL